MPKQIITEKGNLITEKPEKEVMKRVEVKVPEKMYNQLKIKFGHNLSKVMREHFRQIINRDELELDKFKFCFGCGKVDCVIDDLYLGSGIDMDGDYKYFRYILCPECKENLSEKLKLIADKINAKKKLSEQEEVHFVLGSSFISSKQGAISLVATICKHFPDKVIVDKGILKSNCSEQENRKILEELDDMGVLP